MLDTQEFMATTKSESSSIYGEREEGHYLFQIFHQSWSKIEPASSTEKCPTISDTGNDAIMNVKNTLGWWHSLKA